jgi:hypothetical protein
MFNLWIGNDGARMWRYLVGVSSHSRQADIFLPHMIMFLFDLPNNRVYAIGPRSLQRPRYPLVVHELIVVRRRESRERRVALRAL